jgi:hypothetical protein
MKLVYRFEKVVDGHWKPRGPYHGPPEDDGLKEALMLAHHCSKDHPLPWAIRDPWFSCAYTGCNTPESLLAWFAGFIPLLHKHGYDFVCYRCVPFRVSKPDRVGQVVFKAGELLKIPEDLKIGRVE